MSDPIAATPAAAPAASAGDEPEGGRPSHHLLLITGMSGAGKTTALKALEDLGFECIDHLPLRLLPRLLPTKHDDSPLPAQRLAIGVDVRTRDFAVETCLAIVDRLRLDPCIAVQLIFLYCDEEELRRRYTATRHRHPLSGQMPLIEGIAHERQMLSPLRSRADLTIDTSAVNPGHLKRMLQGHLGLTEQSGLLIQVTSFSFRSGLPRDADLVFDVRFLANPYYQAELRGLTGRDAAVQQFIRGDGVWGSFFDSLTRLLQPLLPRYVAEGKSYLTIAIGCTGGRHRSVFVTEELASWLIGQGQRVQVLHRDLERSGGRVARPEAKAP